MKVACGVNPKREEKVVLDAERLCKSEGVRTVGEGTQTLLGYALLRDEQKCT